MSIFAYYFQLIFLTHYVSGKIEGHVPPQSTTVKNGAHIPPKLPEAPIIKASQIPKANFAYGWPSVQSRLSRWPPFLLSPQPQLVQALASYIMEAFGQLLTTQKVTLQSYSNSTNRPSCTRGRIIVSQCKGLKKSLIFRRPL